ncbi:hypothetical protein GCM10023205_37740 [Yinghuangia aomiensis]|uniref:S1 motif domain-containing protein n=1 Tax=Yinghuangia aomiensis TaxID=676205 RepID=A0ABP9HEA4_9ACTN
MGVDHAASGYSWPGNGTAAQARDAWAAAAVALPPGTLVTAEVVARQPFGVFIRIDSVPDALGLNELPNLPDGVLPTCGTRVCGTVLDHTPRNRQVRVRFTPQSG